MEVFLVIGKGVDDGRFLLFGEIDIDSIFYEEFLLFDEEFVKNKREKEFKKR